MGYTITYVRGFIQPIEGEWANYTEESEANNVKRCGVLRSSYNENRNLKQAKFVLEDMSVRPRE